jgi:hypothetical protein
MIMAIMGNMVIMPPSMKIVFGFQRIDDKAKNRLVLRVIWCWRGT